MRAGDLVKYSFPRSRGNEPVENELGLVLSRLIDSSLPPDWPRILVLWNDGKRESMHEEDLEVFSEGR